MTEHHSTDEHPEPDDRDPTETNEPGEIVPAEPEATDESTDTSIVFSPLINDGTDAASNEAALQCAREQDSLVKPVNRAQKKMSGFKQKALALLALEVGYLTRVAAKEAEQKAAEEELAKPGPIEGPVRMVPTPVAYAVKAVAVAVAYWMDYAALEALLHTSRTATLFIALGPLLIETVTAWLYGKYRKRRDLAFDEVNVGRSVNTLLSTMLVVGIVHALVVGTVRGIFTSVLSGLIFGLLAMFTWMVIAATTYAAESPLNTVINRARFWAWHFKHMAHFTGTRKWWVFRRKFLPARQNVILTASVLVDRVRNIYRNAYLRHELSLPQGLRGPQFAQQYLPWSEGEFDELDLSEEDLEPKLDISSDSNELPPPSDAPTGELPAA